MANKPDAGDVRLDLVHPVYLDVPMMITFLAALRNGVSFEDESTRRSSSGVDREKGGEGKVGLPGIGSLLGLDFSGRTSKKDRQEESEELKAVRQHTSASLFNALRHHLTAGDYIVRINEQKLFNVKLGQLVEASGAFVGNPLEDLLALVGRFVPYIDIDDSAKKSVNEASKAKKSGNPQVRARAEMIGAEAAQIATQAAEQEFGLKIFNQMREDLVNAHVHDVLLNGPDGLKVVLTLASEFFSEATAEYLREGHFSVLGKVTRILGEGEEINLARRTVVGSAGATMTKQIIENFRHLEGIDIDTAEPIITYPALQVLPLAVFV